MPGIPVLKSCEVIALLDALGFVETRRRGSHKQFRHSDGRATTAPNHGGRDISPILLRQIANPADVNDSGSYGYDVLDRLTSALRGGVSRGYGYDAIGNRTQSNVDAASTTYAYSGTSHRLQSLTGATTRSYVYDAAGNPTQIDAAVHGYNLANRLTSVSSASSASYAINGLGQRVAKTVDGVTTRYVYDEQGRLIGEYDQAGNLIQETVWLDDLPIATLRPTGSGTPTPIAVYYVHADHLGSPRAITRPSDDAIVWRWDNAEPFGNNQANENPSGLGTFRYDLRFPGQQYDQETETHYNYFRDYDPTTGRYRQSDPIGLWGGVATYGYVLADPMRLVDVFGLDITVCYYNDAAGGLGHIGFGLPGERGTIGFYPIGNAVSSPGVVKPDAQNNQTCKTVPADPKKDSCMKRCRERRETNPGQYRLSSRQCTSFVRDCLQECGIFNGGYTGPAPLPYFHDLPVRPQ